MASGTCRDCDAPTVWARGLCGRCYQAERRGAIRASVVSVEVRSVERAWDARQLVAALVAELPEPGRHRGDSWVALAACRDQRDLPWEGRRVTVAMAAVCAACPVRDRCLAEAVADPTIDGVWAATTPADRREMRARVGVGGPVTV